MEAKDVGAPRNIIKRLSVWAVVVVAILMIPFVANAPWTGSDFVFAGVVLFVLATIYELATRNMTNPKHRAIVAAIVLFMLVLVQAWAAAGP